MDPMQILSTLSLDAALTEIVPVAQFVVGMVVYAVFVFKFYRFLADREIFDFKYSKYSEGWGGSMKKVGLFILQLFSYLFLFPLFVIFWFGAIVILLVFLTKTQSIESVLIISISLVTAIRVTAYYTEDLSRDLAKMLPFALLGVFIVESAWFSVDDSIAMLQTLPQHLDKIVYYCLFVIVLELVLRVLHGVKTRVFPKKKKEEEEVKET